MSDVFISYARVDRERVEPIAKLLQAQGFSVWWDEAINPGENFRDTIRKALTRARCVLVVWSGASVKSRWVIDEAEEALERGILIPLLLDPVLGDIPHGFRGLQAADLSAWQGEASDAAWVKLTVQITTLLGLPDKPHAKPAPRPSEPAAKPVSVSMPRQKSSSVGGVLGSLLGIGALGAAAAAVFFFYMAPDGASVRAVPEVGEPRVRERTTQPSAQENRRTMPTPSDRVTTEPGSLAIPSGCQVTIRNTLVDLSETPENFGQTSIRVPPGTYTVLAGRMVTWAGRQQRWFEIQVGSRRGWIKDSGIVIDSRTSACP